MAKCVQSNLNHSRGAQDLLRQFVLEEGIDICLVSEPYVVPDIPTWLSSDDGLAAIHWRAGGNAGEGSLLGKGRGYVAAKIGDIAVILVYISPNIRLAEFIAHLEDLARVIQLAGDSGRGVLVGGDFNARSHTWDPSWSNRRGELLEEWVASCGMRLRNAGKTATCVRPQGSSVVDLTWSSVNLGPVIYGWQVLKDQETLSDHRYILYSVGVPRREERRSGTSHVRWSWSKFNPENFADALSLTLSWGPAGEDHTTPTGLAGWIERSMTQACESDALVERGAGGYTQILRSSERASKAKAWRDLVGSVEADPWGLPYKLVIGKLRTSQKGLTETLEEDTLRSLLNSLFPRGDGRAPTAQSGSRWDEGWAVTTEEVRAALKKGCAQSVAPGPVA
ncbi:uncharacterized protein LOC124416192 [Diprion similis]|uniref:uncharacterized protein LOC124416192 n=1 Tax=Diprion similis TaxID=362088 RepID=UPI001EF81AAB|nr:uncharacterized protein LOC124416192 [Diprion similis]